MVTVSLEIPCIATLFSLHICKLQEKVCRAVVDCRLSEVITEVLIPPLVFQLYILSYCRQMVQIKMKSPGALVLILVQISFPEDIQGNATPSNENVVESEKPIGIAYENFTMTDVSETFTNKTVGNISLRNDSMIPTFDNIIFANGKITMATSGKIKKLTTKPKFYEPQDSTSRCINCTEYFIIDGRTGENFISSLFWKKGNNTLKLVRK